MNVTSTTAVNCLLATLLEFTTLLLCYLLLTMLPCLLLLESLPNNGEKVQSAKRVLSPKCNYGKISVKCACILVLSGSGIQLYIYTGRMVVLGKLVHSVSINPVLSTIKLLR